MFIKEFTKKIFYGKRYNSTSYVKFLKSIGISIGEGTIIFDPLSTFIDPSRPWLINIGKNVQITRGVTIVTHGYDWSVLKGKYGDVLGSSGSVNIGDNVFIGMQTTILKGVNVGNNVIIGANSLVTKDIPDDCVAAGNPCRVIMSIEDYYEKRKNAQYREAKEMVQIYRTKFNKNPDERKVSEFFWLFTDGDSDLPECWNEMLKLVGNYEFSKERLAQNDKKFEDIEDFFNSF